MIKNVSNRAVVEMSSTQTTGHRNDVTAQYQALSKNDRSQISNDQYQVLHPNYETVTVDNEDQVYVNYTNI